MKYLQTEEQRALSLHWEGLWACPLLSFFWCMDSKTMPASDILQLEILKDNHSLSILSEIKAERLTRLKAEQTLHKGILERQNFVIWTLSWKIQQQPFVFLKGAAPVARYNRFHKPLSSYPPSREAQPSLSMLRSFCAVFFCFLIQIIMTESDGSGASTHNQQKLQGTWLCDASGSGCWMDYTYMTNSDGQKHPHKYFISSSIPPTWCLS